MLLKIDEFFKKSLRIYGALRLCSSDDWIKAFWELATTLLFALFAIWVPLIVYPMFGREDRFFQIIAEQVGNGELYIITTALLAPVFYFTFPNARLSVDSQTRNFPSQQIIILIFIITIILSVLAIAATKLQDVGEEPIPPRMINWSWWLFGVSTGMYYLTLVVRNWLERGGVDDVYDRQSAADDEEMPESGNASAGRQPRDPDEFVGDVLAQHAVKDE